MNLFELLGVWLVLVRTGPLCPHAHSILIFVSSFPRVSVFFHRRLHCLSHGNCLAWPPQFNRAAGYSLGFWVTCRAGHRSLENDSMNRQCRILPTFLYRSFNNVDSSPSFFNRSIDNVGSGPSFFNRIFDNVGSSPSFFY
jgi:hypothetical protein